MCDFLLKSQFRIAGIAYFNTSHVSHSYIYNLYDILCNHLMFYYVYMQGRIQGGGRTRRAPPLKLDKIRFFGVKSCFFTRNTPKFFAPPSARRKFFKCAPP